MRIVEYQDWMRAFVERLPIGVSIAGRRAAFVRGVCDRLFPPGSDLASVVVLDNLLTVRVKNRSERLLFYAPRNVLRSYIRTPLYALMCDVAKQNRGIGLFLDIGANLGMYSLLARNLGFHPVCYEPEPLHFDFLQRNERSFGTVRALALSDTAGFADFFVNAYDNPGASSLVTSGGSARGAGDANMVQVAVSTVDLEIQKGIFNPEGVRLIKVDVEGNEEKTLAGMQGYLARSDAALVWCEVRGSGSRRGENNYLAIIDFMQRFGYAPFVAELGPLRPFRALRPPPQVFDLLFQVPGRHNIMSIGEAPVGAGRKLTS